ncbi:hypothetical protein QR680_017256 [Steinernema hermaphroditum]|uniref:Uncharacterized protein n=1 Tax=Steinernema hermaphroditum TaxID=289476 RepID=A0AA39HDW9_9BILA|nr:hypothetical protein QR680_017256 [Steinernema hermaphroditum]
MENLPQHQYVERACSAIWDSSPRILEPCSEEIRQIHRFNQNVMKDDIELLDKLEPCPKLADVINAAYYLEMPDFIHMSPLQSSAPSTKLIRRMLKTPGTLNAFPNVDASAVSTSARQPLVNSNNVTDRNVEYWPPNSQSQNMNDVDPQEVEEKMIGTTLRKHLGDNGSPLQHTLPKRIRGEQEVKNENDEITAFAKYVEMMMRIMTHEDRNCLMDEVYESMRRYRP